MRRWDVSLERRRRRPVRGRLLREIAICRWSGRVVTIRASTEDCERCYPGDATRREKSDPHQARFSKRARCETPDDDDPIA
jgi:hypothetical protein